MCDMEVTQVGGHVRCKSADKRLRRRLQILDYLLALFVFGPLCILYWRGTYQLSAFYILPDWPVVSATISTVVGCIVQILVSVAQRALPRAVDPLPHLIRVVITRGYTMVYALVLVNHWRGLWELIDRLTGTSIWSSATSTVVGFVALVFLRSLRNVLAPPLIVSLDLPEDYFVVPTFFKCHTSGDRIPKFVGLVGDSVFSVVVVGSLVVFIWRGVWTMLDKHFLTWSAVASATGSVFLGYLLAAVVLVFQKHAAVTAARLHASNQHLLKLLFEDFFVFCGSVSCIFVWRGLWILADQLFLPDNFELSNWVSLIVGLLGLILGYNGNTILSRGVYLDGDLPDGQGCIFPIDYLTLLHEMRNSSRIKAVPQPVPLVAISEVKINGEPFLREDNTIPFIDEEKSSDFCG